MPTDWLEVTRVWEGLIGVVLGAGLATVGSAVGRLFTRNRIKAAIEDELRANRHQIAQKRDILCQMLDALSKHINCRGAGPAVEERLSQGSDSLASQVSVPVIYY